MHGGGSIDLKDNIQMIATQLKHNFPARIMCSVKDVSWEIFFIDLQQNCVKPVLKAK